MNKKTKKIIKILKIINSNWTENGSRDEKNCPGRKQVYSELTLFKIFILMNLLEIKTIKGIWRYLMDNQRIKKVCGLADDIDRSTLSRRLSDKIKPWFNQN